ncbi:MAG: type III-A CRISPR-associated RAMP protein Csm4 [Vicingaceae bacterium]|nr:MAG: type III-A CRISPR-associated RAMP protein Csm4 [Vicingaceae bacterium]
MPIKIIRLKFNAPLHISTVKSEYDISEKIVHSDTLYSAILEAWNVLGMHKFIPASTDEKLQFSISSLFPYITQGNQTIYFLPRPLNFIPHDIPIELNKKIKKIQYIDASIIKKIQETYSGEFELRSDFIKGMFYTDKEINENFISTSVVPRVRVSRNNEDAKPFYIERIYFNENSGFYFFLIYEDDVIYHAIKSALDYLQDAGIGTDRNVGHGTFTYTVENDSNPNIPKFTIQQPHYALNLSLYIPEDHNLAKAMLNDAYFDILTRGGWITSFPYNTLRKKNIRCIKEGSVLNISNIKSNNNILTSGKIADITPERNQLPAHTKNIHSIFRIGISIWIPFPQNLNLKIGLITKEKENL